MLKCSQFAEYALGLTLWDKQKEIVDEYFNGTKTHGVWALGRRSGKTLLAAVAALYVCFVLEERYRRKVRKKEKWYVVTIDNRQSLKQLRQKFIETKLSKLVVYDGNIDRIIGYVHQLDLFSQPQQIADILHPIPAVPESMSASDLIGKFSRERKSIAWVVDEFGGTAGIVTMEDVLEELFGEIQDEYDTEEFLERKLDNGDFILSGRLELDYLQEKYGLEFV